MQPDENDIHVWRLLLPLERPIHEQLDRYLSKDEIERRDRFRFDSDKLRYSIARGALRDILSRYLAANPSEFNFCYTEHGKPYLKSHPVQFNVSHSHNLILYAISKSRAVGIDVEFCKQDLDFLALAQTFCSPLEYRQLLTSPVEARKNLFFQFWTRKEAFVKAMGQGLSFPLKNLDIHRISSSESPFQGKVTRLDMHEEHPSDMEQVTNLQNLQQEWHIQDISLEENEEYFAAIAVENRISQNIQYLAWQG